jgi:hypothetical protein
MEAARAKRRVLEGQRCNGLAATVGDPQVAVRCGVIQLQASAGNSLEVNRIRRCEVLQQRASIGCGADMKAKISRTVDDQLIAAADECHFQAGAKVGGNLKRASRCQEKVAGAGGGNGGRHIQAATAIFDHKCPIIDNSRYLAGDRHWRSSPRRSEHVLAEGKRPFDPQRYVEAAASGEGLGRGVQRGAGMVEPGRVSRLEPGKGIGWFARKPVRSRTRPRVQHAGQGTPADRVFQAF